MNTLKAEKRDMTIKAKKKDLLQAIFSDAK